MWENLTENLEKTRHDPVRVLQARAMAEAEATRRFGELIAKASTDEEKYEAMLLVEEEIGEVCSKFASALDIEEKEVSEYLLQKLFGHELQVKTASFTAKTEMGDLKVSLDKGYEMGMTTYEGDEVMYFVNVMKDDIYIASIPFLSEEGETPAEAQLLYDQLEKNKLSNWPPEVKQQLDMATKTVESSIRTAQQMGLEGMPDEEPGSEQYLEEEYDDTDLPYQGTIVDISGGMSGIAQITIDQGDGDTTTVMVESGFGVRQLVNAFDGNPIGQQIEYDVDDMGIMTNFVPAGFDDYASQKIPMRKKAQELSDEEIAGLKEPKAMPWDREMTNEEKKRKKEEQQSRDREIGEEKIPPALKQILAQLNSLDQDIAKIEADLKPMKQQRGQIEKDLIPQITELVDLDDPHEVILRCQGKVWRMIEKTKTTPHYKEGLSWIYQKISPQLQKIVNRIMLAKQTVSRWYNIELKASKTAQVEQLESDYNNLMQQLAEIEAAIDEMMSVSKTAGLNPHCPSCGGLQLNGDNPKYSCNTCGHKFKWYRDGTYWHDPDLETHDSQLSAGFGGVKRASLEKTAEPRNLNDKVGFLIDDIEEVSEEIRSMMRDEMDTGYKADYQDLINSLDEARNSLRIYYQEGYYKNLPRTSKAQLNLFKTAQQVFDQPTDFSKDTENMMSIPEESALPTGETGQPEKPPTKSYHKADDIKRWFGGAIPKDDSIVMDAQGNMWQYKGSVGPDMYEIELIENDGPSPDEQAGGPSGLDTGLETPEGGPEMLPEEENPPTGLENVPTEEEALPEGEEEMPLFEGKADNRAMKRTAVSKECKDCKYFRDTGLMLGAGQTADRGDCELWGTHTYARSSCPEWEPKEGYEFGESYTQAPGMQDDQAAEGADHRMKRMADILNSEDRKQIDFLVDRLHVSVPDEEIENDIRKRIHQLNESPDPTVEELYVAYALRKHHQNQDLYRDVMHGNLESEEFQGEDPEAVFNSMGEPKDNQGMAEELQRIRKKKAFDIEVKNVTNKGKLEDTDFGKCEDCGGPLSAADHFLNPPGLKVCKKCIDKRHKKVTGMSDEKYAQLDNPAMSIINLYGQDPNLVRQKVASMDQDDLAHLINEVQKVPSAGDVSKFLNALWNDKYEKTGDIQGQEPFYSTDAPLADHSPQVRMPDSVHELKVAKIKISDVADAPVSDQELAKLTLDQFRGQPISSINTDDEYVFVTFI